MTVLQHIAFSVRPALFGVLIALFASGFPLYAATDTAPFRLYEVGFRAGSTVGSGPDFTQYELAAAFRTPMGWRSENERLAARLDVHTGGGVLRGQGDTAGIFHAGPAVDLGVPPFPVSLSLGVAPTYLTGRRFGEVDFGQRLQFTSSATFTVFLIDELGLRYRIQHMSNARMAEPNPGLDTHSLGIVFSF